MFCCGYNGNVRIHVADGLSRKWNRVIHFAPRLKPLLVLRPSHGLIGMKNGVSVAVVVLAVVAVARVDGVGRAEAVAHHPRHLCVE